MLGDDMPTEAEHQANYELLTILVRDLVEMHNDAEIDLNGWPAAREMVVAYHDGRPSIRKPWQRGKK